MKRGLLPACLLLVVLPCVARAGGKAGIGSGVPYGTPLVGFGLEVDLGKYVSLLGGVGAGTYRSPWSVGARVKLLRIARPGGRP